MLVGVIEFRPVLTCTEINCLLVVITGAECGGGDGGPCSPVGTYGQWRLTRNKLLLGYGLFMIVRWVLKEYFLINSAGGTQVEIKYNQH